jgi:streptomycin 3"-adenylyltransferase
MEAIGWETCPQPTRAQLLGGIALFRNAIGDALHSVCLHGSLALGCFNPTRSDVDLLLVVSGALHPDQQRRLAFAVIATANQPHPLELSVMNRDALVRWRHPCPYLFHYSSEWHERLMTALSNADWEDWREREPQQLDPDLAGHVTVARARGVALFGPAPAAVFPEVPPADFQDSILADVLSDVHGLPNLAAVENPVYAVLNACRTLAHLRGGALLSKDEGGAWALLALPWRMSAVAARALECYRRPAEPLPFDRDDLRRFGDYMLAEIRSIIGPRR